MEKIGYRETKWLFFLLMASNVITGAVSMLSGEFASGGFIPVIVSAVLALFLVYVTNRCLGKDGVLPLNPLMSKLLGTALFLVTVIAAGTRMKHFAAAIGDIVLVQSPKVFILFIMASAVLSVMLLRLEAVTRYALASSMVFLLFLAIIAFSTFSEFDVRNIYPVMGKGNFLNSWSALYIFSDIVYFYVIFPHIKNSDKARRVPYKAIVLCALFTLILFAIYTLCVPYPVSQTFKYPIYRLAVLANSSVVFQRLDGVVFIIWIFLSFISSGSLALFAVMIFKKVFCLKNQNAICPAVALLCFGISLWDADFDGFVKTAMSLASFFVLPCLAFVFKYIKKKRV